MGEIADALKRAGSGRSDDVRPQRVVEEAPVEAPPAEPVYSRAIDVSRVAREAAELVEEAPDERHRVEIPRSRDSSWVSRCVLVAPNTPAAECFRHLAITVSRELHERKANSVLIVGGLRREGKTTTASNLALALAGMAGGRRTALVDLDMRKPSLARVFGLAPEIGVEEALSGHASLGEVRVQTDLEGLDLFPVARAVAQPHELLAGEGLPYMMRELERVYDTVVVDSAPLLLVPDTELIYPHVGGIAAIMRAGQTKRNDFERLMKTIPEEKLIGTFMNEVRNQRHIKRYGYYGRDR